MSYCFDMYFARADSLKEALLLANQFVGAVCTMPRMEKAIRENVLHLPTVKYVAKPNERKFSALADRYFLYSLFNFRFVYWEKYKLLGMQDEQDFEEDWKTVFGMNGIVKVLFQSSCANNMAPEKWPKEIPYFRKACREYQRLLRQTNYPDHSKARRIFL